MPRIVARGILPRSPANQYAEWRFWYAAGAVRYQNEDLMKTRIAILFLAAVALLAADPGFSAQPRNIAVSFPCFQLPGVGDFGPFPEQEMR